ncbi:unnamed protein product [Camellia sinensis]
MNRGEKEFVYESCTPLSSSSGSIEGSFTFVSGRYCIAMECGSPFRILFIIHHVSLSDHDLCGFTTRNRMLVFVPPHPLVKHWVAVLRNEQTPCPIFREIQSPMGIVPILRAGLALAEHASSTDMVNWDHWWSLKLLSRFC